MRRFVIIRHFLCNWYTVNSKIFLPFSRADKSCILQTLQAFFEDLLELGDSQGHLLWWGEQLLFWQQYITVQDRAVHQGTQVKTSGPYLQLRQPFRLMAFKKFQCLHHVSNAFLWSFLLNLLVTCESVTPSFHASIQDLWCLHLSLVHSESCPFLLNLGFEDTWTVWEQKFSGKAPAPLFVPLSMASKS